MVKYFFPLTHLSRSTVSTYTQNRDLEDFLLSKCVSNKTRNNLTWFSTMSDRMVQILFPSHSPLSTGYTHKKIMIWRIFSSSNTFLMKIKNLTWFSIMPGRMMKISFSSHPHLPLYRPHIHTKSRFGGFSLLKMGFKRNNKNMTLFSTMPDWMVKISFPHPPLSLYRLYIHTKSRFGGFSLQ